MLKKRGEDWKAKGVKIIGISIDQTKDSVQKHVTAKGWELVEHYHRHESDCSKVYSVSGVPHVMLVDQQGKIAFKGHPANRPDLEADLDALSRGEKLTGKGTGPEPAEDKKDEQPEKPQLDVSATVQEVNKFQEVF